MIPENRDERMLVQMTRGELSETVRAAVSEAVSQALQQATDKMAISERRSEVLVGMKEIGDYLGMNARTVYGYMHRGLFGNAIRKLGSKCYADREELRRIALEQPWKAAKYNYKKGAGDSEEGES